MSDNTDEDILMCQTLSMSRYTLDYSDAAKKFCLYVLISVTDFFTIVNQGYTW